MVRLINAVDTGFFQVSGRSRCLVPVRSETENENKINVRKR